MSRDPRIDAYIARAQPFALAYLAWLAWLAWQGQGTTGIADGWTYILLLCAGPVTAAPLVLFAAGWRRLRVATMSLLQYLSPTLQFLLAVLFYGEAFTLAHALAFGAIWIALALYVGALVRAPKLPQAPE